MKRFEDIKLLNGLSLSLSLSVLLGELRLFNVSSSDSEGGLMTCESMVCFVLRTD